MNNPYIGSSLDDLLRELGIYESCKNAAQKEIFDWWMSKFDNSGFIQLNTEEFKTLLTDIENPPEPTPAYLKAKKEFGETVKGNTDVNLSGWRPSRRASGHRF